MSYNLDDYRSSMESKYGPEWREQLRVYARIGGQAKVCKGIGRMTPERRAEISRKGVEARRAKNGGH